MFQQCDKRYTDVFRLLAVDFMVHNNLIFKTMPPLSPLLFRVGGLFAIGPTSTKSMLENINYALFALLNATPASPQWAVRWRSSSLDLRF